MAANNYKMLSEYQGFNKIITLLCPNNHVWKTKWYRFEKGHRYPECVGNKRHTQIQIQEVLNTSGYQTKDVYINAFSKMKLTCPDGHSWDVKMNDFKNGHRCPKCYINAPEQELLKFFEINNIEHVYRDTKIIKQELDIYVPKHNLAIEYCGLYWHSELYKKKNFHLNKLLACQKKGIRLLTIFEDEWLNKKEIVLSKIKSVIGKTTKIYARNCEMKEINTHEFNSFNSKNSLFSCIPSEAVGLFFNEVLVMCVGIYSGYTSFCSRKDTTVVGGISKLLKHVKHRPLVISLDLRWSNGDTFKKLGFVLNNTSTPNYTYIKKHQRITKQEDDLVRIWDCGKQFWILS
jgi:hypothetical protein